MGMETSLMSYFGGTFKDIYFNGHYHDAMYKGNKLIWEKFDQYLKFRRFKVGIDTKLNEIYDSMFVANGRCLSLYNTGEIILLYEMRDDLSLHQIGSCRYIREGFGQGSAWCLKVATDKYLFAYYNRGGEFLFRSADGATINLIEEVKIKKGGKVITQKEPNINLRMSGFVYAGNGYTLVEIHSFPRIFFKTQDFVYYEETSLPYESVSSGENVRSACYCRDGNWRITIYERRLDYRINYKTYITNDFITFQESSINNDAGMEVCKIQDNGAYFSVYAYRGDGTGNYITKYTKDFVKFTENLPILNVLQESTQGSNSADIIAHNSKYLTVLIKGTNSASDFWNRYAALICDLEMKNVVGVVDKMPDFDSPEEDILNSNIPVYYTICLMTDENLYMYIQDAYTDGYRFIISVPLKECDKNV